jgi:predicted ester cyclase
MRGGLFMSSKVLHSSVKEIAEEFADKVWNDKEIDAIDRLVDKNVIIHSLLGDFQGVNSMKDVAQIWLKAFPDLRVDNKLVIAENDLVSIQWQAYGTHRGEFKGKRPTGKRVFYGGVTIYCIKNNKIIEYWAYIDMQHILNQI